MRAKRFSKIFGMGTTVFLAVLACATLVFAGVVPGDVIDKTNWQKAEGLLPESVLEWVKIGDYILKVGELQYDPKEFMTEATRRSMTANIGKYDLDEDDIIVDATTRGPPGFIEGIPFPDVSLDDPKAGVKLMYNRQYYFQQNGNAEARNQAMWVGRGGHEREISNRYINLAMDGPPQARSLRNPEGFFKKAVIAVDYPFDIAGFAMLLWRYSDNRPDVTFSYVPSIRRVRRMSPANRSDSFLGSDFCVDDPYGYDGKVSMFNWRVIGQKEALMPFRSVTPERIVVAGRGHWETTSGITRIVYGYETEDWQGAPWAPTNLVWAKKPVILIEGVAKDPYYNYGRQIMWYYPEMHGPKYKVIYDRSGQYWKTMLISFSAYELDDKSHRMISVDVQDVIDDRTRHASLIRTAAPDNIWRFNVELEQADFTMAGFQKFCR